MTMTFSGDLENLLRRSPLKPEEYIKRAIVLYDVATKAVKLGQRIAVLDKEGNILHEITGL